MPSTLTGTAQPLLRELIDIPERVYQGDFALRLTEGVQRRQATLDSYVITPQLRVALAPHRERFAHGLIGEVEPPFIPTRRQWHRWDRDR